METLTYVHLATTAQNSEEIKLTLNCKTLPSSAWIRLGAIAITLTLLGIASSRALALQTGNQGTQVIALQQKLKAAGYFNGTATGFYGSQTQAAVSKFQQARGLAVDGIAGSNTLAALSGTPNNSTPVPTGILLQRGNRSTAVTQLQNTLKAKGFFKGPVTGYYGSITEAAVRTFQQSKGLRVDGIAGPNTLAALNNNPPVVDGNIPTGTELRYGDSSPAVSQLQTRLKTVGFYKYEVSGFYGRLTEQAVKDFQKSRKISVNGIAGPTTLAALQGVSSGNSSITTLRRGSRGTAVSQLQTQLKALGWFRTTATGYYGPITEQAVKDFQRSRGISVNGIAGPTTLAALQGVSPYRNSTAIAQRPPTQPIVSLQRGNRSSRVRSLQARLIELGYYKGPKDGIFGSDTEAALKRYQQDRGLIANGIAGANTFASLGSESYNS